GRRAWAGRAHRRVDGHLPQAGLRRAAASDGEAAGRSQGMGDDLSEGREARRAGQPALFRAHEDAGKPEWAAAASGARQAAAEVAAAALLGLRTVRAENYQAVRAKYPAVADTCNACHRTFARDAVTVKP